MVKIKNAMVLWICLAAMTGCDKNKVYDKFDKDFPENRWQKNDAREYDFSINDDTKTYNVSLAFSHIDKYQFAEIPLHVDLEKPDHLVISKDIALVIKDKSGKQLGQCDGDYCDLYQDLLPAGKLAKGNYKVKITHKFRFGFVPNILGLGVKVTVVP